MHSIILRPTAISGCIRYESDSIITSIIRHLVERGQNKHSTYLTYRNTEQHADLDAAFGDNWDTYVNHYIKYSFSEGKKFFPYF